MVITDFLGISPGFISGISVDGLMGNVVLEYDGGYYHKNRLQQDTQNTLKLLAQGYRILRIREGELPLLEINDDNLVQLKLREKEIYRDGLKTVKAAFDGIR